MANGTWLWWATLPSEWTAWVIDDSWRRGIGTEYRIAVSVKTVTFFSPGRFIDFREAKVAAVTRALHLQWQPLANNGHFSKERKST
jgi:hypothetical protein